MSRVDDVISEYCPNGAPYLSVRELSIKTSNIKWADSDGARFLYIDLSSVDRVTKRIDGCIEITAATAPSRAQQIVFEGDVIFATTRPTQMRWTVIPPQFDGQIASTGYCVIRPNTDLILTRFLAHSLATDLFKKYVEQNQVEGNYPSISDARVRDYRLAVPPLAVQVEIVRTLDAFAELEAELEEELEARRKQYEFYRGHLLSAASENERMIRVSDAVRVVSAPGKIERSEYLVTGLIPIVDQSQSFIAGYTNNSEISLKAEPFIIFGDHTRAVKYVDFEFVQGADGLKILRAHSDFHPRYLYHALCNLEVPSRGYNRHWTVLRALEIWAPPLEDQLRLARILDSFDELVTSITFGLPAELAARRKQYEYYRDRLLTFPEKVA